MIYFQVSVSRPIHITVGESHTACTGQSSWPETLHKCSIPDDSVSVSDDETVIKVTFDNLEALVTLKKGWHVHVHVPQLMNTAQCTTPSVNIATCSWRFTLLFQMRVKPGGCQELRTSLGHP